MQEEQIEPIGATAGERLLRGRAQVTRILGRLAQGWAGEPRKAFRTIALPMIKIVADRANEAVTVAQRPLERTAEKRVGFAGAIDIGSKESADPFFVGEADEFDEAIVRQRLTKVHEPSATPHSESGFGQLHWHTEIELVHHSTPRGLITNSRDLRRVGHLLCAGESVAAGNRRMRRSRWTRRRRAAHKGRRNAGQ